MQKIYIWFIAFGLGTSGLWGQPIECPEAVSGIYSVYLNAIKARDAGKTPFSILDYDDNLGQTAPRYTASLQALKEKFGLEFSKPEIHPADIQYVNSFNGTISRTLIHLGVPKQKVEELYPPNVSPSEAETEFYRIFFDMGRVSKDPLFPGAQFFLSNHLSLMRALKGKVLIASGRKDKYRDVTRASFIHAGVPEDLVIGSHLVWYLRPEAGHTIESEVRLDFHNNKGDLVDQIRRDSQNEVVGVGDNEYRNILQFANRLPASRLFYFRSFDATWGRPELVAAQRDLEDDIGADKMGYTPFRSYLPSPRMAEWIRSEFTRRGIPFVPAVTPREDSGGR